MSRTYPAVFAFLLLCGCREPENKTAADVAHATAKVAGRSTQRSDPGEAFTQKYNVQQDGVIVAHFGRGENTIALHGTLGKPGTTVQCRMELNAGQQLTANVEADGGPANIRINRIVLPDGSSDGPFGKELSYRTKKRGIYTLEIGASLMADNVYKGPFTLNVKAK